MTSVRPLLALVCAALLAAASAVPAPRVRSDDHSGRRGKAYNGQCTTITNGSINGTPIPLPTVFVDPGVQDAVIDIPDNCAPRGQRLTGETVRVCDDTAPEEKMAVFSPVYVHRLGAIAGSAPVDVVQYCT